MRRAIHTQGRSGFTLVELLVVILIISILAALTGAGVVAAIRTANQAQNRAEITQLATGVTAFKQQFQVSYIPSVIVLPPKNASNSGPNGSTLEVQTLANQTTTFLTSVWPRLNPAYLTQAASWGVSEPSQNQPYILTGDEVLVLMLGGRMSANGSGYDTFGFSSDGTNPMKAYSAGEKPLGPFFSFPPQRLIAVQNLISLSSSVPPASLTSSASPFPSFMDTYDERPYVYFSTTNVHNDYNPLRVINKGLVYQFGGRTPAISPLAQIVPYMTSSQMFANPASFQLISGGLNQQFGGGGSDWANGPNGATTQAGADDLSNFSSTLLGTASK